jgi:hypothetical protein
MMIVKIAMAIDACVCVGGGGGGLNVFTPSRDPLEELALSSVLNVERAAEHVRPELWQLDTDLNVDWWGVASKLMSTCDQVNVCRFKAEESSGTPR